MPITILKIDREKKELEAVASGRIHFVEVEKHLREERNADGLTYKEFVDARDAKLSFAMSPFEIREILALVRRLSKELSLGATAVLVSTDFAFGVMSAIEVLVEDVAEIRPFRDEGIARSWLASRPDSDGNKLP